MKGVLHSFQYRAKSSDETSNHTQLRVIEEYRLAYVTSESHCVVAY